MKNYSGLFFLLFFFTQITSGFTQSPGEVDFKMRYEPSHTYNQTITQVSHSEVKYKGSKDVLSKLKANGVSNPTITDSQKEMKSICVTGKKTDSDKFPLTIEFIGTTGSQKSEIPDGTKIYGQCSTDDLPTIDSISSSELSQEYKEAIKGIMQNVFTQMNLPEKKLKEGEHFTTENPLRIPLGGITIDMTITTIYKLISFSNETANFDISQVYKMKTDLSGHTAKGTGGGKGKLIYDIRNNFYLHYQIDTNMDFYVSMDKFDFNVKTNNSFIQDTTITTQP